MNHQTFNMSRVIVTRRLTKILKRCYPNLVVIPTTAFGIRYSYYSNSTFKNKVGEAQYLTEELTPKQRARVEKGDYYFQTDSISNFVKT